MKIITSIIYPAFALYMLVFFGFMPQAQAVVPAPDGGYPGGNTAEGQNALFSLTNGGYNTANGWNSLRTIDSASFNTGIGAGALFADTGDSNTAVGAAALFLNTTGMQNTANGAFALFSNTEGELNTANGAQALQNNTTGSSNTAVGDQALFDNTTGGANSAFGLYALGHNTIGVANVAFGFNSMSANTTGNANAAIGNAALDNNSTGSGNVALGASAGTNVLTADNVVCVGASGQNVSNTTWIGHVYGVTTQSGTTAPVVVSDGGQLGTVASSERFKKDVVGMAKTSEAIMSLRPVTFHYKTDTKGTPQFGLIAEEVAKVNSALVLPDKEGKPYSVRYDQVNAMLLNEFLKEHKTVREQGAMIARQQKQIEALTAGLQKVSAQLEVSKPAPQTVLNNH